MSNSQRCGTGKPLLSLRFNLSKPTVRKAESSRGYRIVQEANAVIRKETEIHNWTDRATAQVERLLTWTR